MRENKDYTGLWLLLMFISLCLLALIVWTVRTDALAGVSVFDYCNWFPSCGGIQTPLQITNEEIVWTEEMEKQRLEALKKEETVKPTPKEEKQQWEPKETKPEAKSIVLSDEIQVIACLNEKNMTIHQPNNWNCFLGQGGKWKNILLPPKSHIEHFKKIFWDDYKYRLAIANYEGSFREDAQNPYAIWYLQTLRSHKVKKDIVSQLTWLKNREEKNTWVACAKYENENFTLFGTINIEKGKLAKYTCQARRHYGAFSPWDGKHWTHSVMYAKRYKVTTEYYLSLSF